MGKKIWYSSPLKFYWNELYSQQKKITPSFDIEKIFACLRYNLMNVPLAGTENLESRELLIAGLELWKEDANKNLLHLFFQDQHLKFFLEKMSLSDLSGIKQYLYTNGENKIIKYLKSGMQKNCIIYNFGLHIPYETDGYAFTFTIYEDNQLELLYFHGLQNGGLTDKMYNELIGKDDKKSILLSSIFRLAINTIAYMKCFPECVIDGVPKITIDRDETRTDNNFTIGLSDKIIELGKISKSKMPHFRSGYFKLLTSDFYTHKKGQLIFVHETMVMAKAKTVYTSDKIKDIE